MPSEGEPKYDSLLFTQSWQLGRAEGNSSLGNLSPAPVAGFQGAISA